MLVFARSALIQEREERSFDEIHTSKYLSGMSNLNLCNSSKNIKKVRVRTLNQIIFNFGISYLNQNQGTIIVNSRQYCGKKYYSWSCTILGYLVHDMHT